MGMPIEVVKVVKPPSRALQHVAASVVGVRGDHLRFVDVKGTPFLRPLVESWEALPGRHLGAFKAPAYCQ
jgi:hypothetical protein